MAEPSGAPARPFEESSELLREIGLGGSAVGTGINTHPAYRNKGHRQSGAHSWPETAFRRTTCAMPCSRTWPWQR